METCEQIAEESREDYQELLVKHHALRQELNALQASRHDQGAAAEPYVMVLIDAHSHKVSRLHGLHAPH